MDGGTITKVWEIDNKLVVADTIEEAIALIKLFAGEDYTPRNVSAIRNMGYSIDYSALIKEGNMEEQNKMDKKKTLIHLGQGTTSRMNHRTLVLPPGLAYEVAKKAKAVRGDGENMGRT